MLVNNLRIICFFCLKPSKNYKKKKKCLHINLKINLIEAVTPLGGGLNSENILRDFGSPRNPTPPI